MQRTQKLARGVWRVLWLRGFSPAVAVLILSVLSLWLVVMYQGPGGIPNSTRARIGYATIWVTRGAMPITYRGRSTLGYWPNLGWDLLRLPRPGPPNWDVELNRYQIKAPMPLLSGLLAIPPAVAMVRRQRRPAPGTCAGCGYSLAGLPAASACPECGSERRVTQRPAAREAVR